MVNIYDLNKKETADDKKEKINKLNYIKNLAFEGLLKFEGEYINGIKIEGKGYNENGKVILEIYKNGKVKEYYDNKTLKFEGEYLNGKRNGKAKKYYDNSILKFEGEYLNGKRRIYKTIFWF